MVINLITFLDLFNNKMRLPIMQLLVSYMSNDGEYDSPLASITFHVVGTND